MEKIEHFLQERLILLKVLFDRKALQLCLYTLTLLAGLFALFVSFVLLCGSAQASSRIKDVVTVEGVRDNLLLGYGIVVGLNGTGDKLNNAIFTEKSLQSFLERLGVNVTENDLKVKNVAAVTVTATLPPFARSGGRIDVTVSTLGDAKSIQGGVLLATPLLGADGEVYAVAQGAIATSGFSAEGKATTVSKGIPTSGSVANGAIIEREIPFELNDMKELNFSLRNPDSATAQEVAAAINAEMQGEIAKVRDPGTVLVSVPTQFDGKVAELLARVEQLEVQPDQIARVVIDESSGTIVMNKNVRIDPVAIAQGNLVVRVEEDVAVSQPAPLAPEGAETISVPKTTISVEEGQGKKLAVLDGGASLQELVDGLNALGVGPRDLIMILQTIKTAGALQAEIETR